MDWRDRAKTYREVTGILTSLVEAASAHGVDTALAKSGIPVLKSLAAINEWWGNRRRAKRIPDDVAEELARCYGIEARSNDRECIERQLAELGVSDPFVAYERALRRLTARVKHPELVDYLHFQCALSRDSQTEVLATLSEGLRQLVQLLGNKYYLRRVEDTLCAHPAHASESEARWFRKRGPIAADFEAGTVYRRAPDLLRLRSSLDQGHGSVLQGVAGSGKTVLAREFAYESYLAGVYPEIVCLDCGEHRFIDEPALYWEVADVQGLLIVEDAHLAAGAVSRLYTRICNRRELSVLLVTRPTLWDLLNPRYDTVCRLKDEVVEVSSSGHADELIGLYAAQHAWLPWPPRVRRSIRTATADSLWLLAYALEGRMEQGGEGDVNSWVASGVQEDLGRLELDNPDYPCALVALSPLFQHEVLTAESFLTTQLRIPLSSVNELLARGEVVATRTPKETFYGLPHSGLARAYWAHGTTYRRRVGITSYEDFLHAYVTAGAGNSLEALVASEDDIRNRVERRLAKTGSMAQVVESELSPSAIADWLNTLGADLDLREDVLQTVSVKLAHSGNLTALSTGISGVRRVDQEAACKLCDVMDMVQIARAVREAEAKDHVGFVVTCVCSASKAAGGKLGSLIDYEELAEALTRSGSFGHGGSCLRALHAEDPSNGERLCGLLNLTELASQLSHPVNIDQVSSWLRALRLVDPSKAAMVCRRLSLEQLAFALSHHRKLHHVGSCIRAVLASDPDVGVSLVRKLDTGALAQTASGIAFPDHVTSCIRAVMAVDRDTACDLCARLSLEEMPAAMARGEHARGLRRMVRRSLRQRRRDTLSGRVCDT